MTIKITTLIENKCHPTKVGLAAEHGLSFFIEIGKPIQKRILFDTGQSGDFLENARPLNVDLALTDTVVISHGHYDHSGGFRKFVEAYGTAFELFVGAGFFTPKYARDAGQWKFLGSDFTAAYLAVQGIRTREVEQDVLPIYPGVYLMRNFPPTNDFESPNPRFYLFEEGVYKPDPFDDELIIVLETAKGLIVLLGCSHPGAVNILTAVKTRLAKPLSAVIGGTHLIEADDRRLAKTFAFFRAQNLSMLGLSHCTGDYALNRLQQMILPYAVNSTGTIIHFQR